MWTMASLVSMPSCTKTSTPLCKPKQLVSREHVEDSSFMTRIELTSCYADNSSDQGGDPAHARTLIAGC